MIAIYYGATVDDKYRNIIKFTINSICEFFDYNIIVIDPKKSNKLTKLLNNDKIKFVKYNFDDEKCWSALISKCENILEQNNIEKVIYFRTPIIGNFKNNIDTPSKYILDRTISLSIYLLIIDSSLFLGTSIIYSFLGTS